MPTCTILEQIKAKGSRKAMGLAASQARFLCLTARKANCTFKTTTLAQEKLSLTSQLADISDQYAAALNATTLCWHNPLMDEAFGLTYTLLMNPSAMNDYEPHIVTNTTGALVLNSEYAAAAEAAGISKVGGASGSQEQRNKFFEALVAQGMLTNETWTKIGTDTWDPFAGMGGEVKDTIGVETLTLNQLMLSEEVGLRVLDLARLRTVDKGLTQGANRDFPVISMNEYEDNVEHLQNLYKKVRAGRFAENATDINKLLREDIKEQEAIKKGATVSSAEYTIANQKSLKYSNYSKIITALGNGTIKVDPTTQEFYKYNPDAPDDRTPPTFTDIGINDSSSFSSGDLNSAGTFVSYVRFSDLMNIYVNEQYTSYMNHYHVADNSGKYMKNADGTYSLAGASYSDQKYSLKNVITLDQAIYLNKENKGLSISGSSSGPESRDFTVVINGGFETNENDLSQMGIGTLLANDFTLIYQNTNPVDAALSGFQRLKNFSDSAINLFDQIAAVFGYGQEHGVGLNVDDASEAALQTAYNMTKFYVLSAQKAVTAGKSQSNDDTILMNNDAYANAMSYNRIVTDQNVEYIAINMSNVLSCFLTYYANALAGMDAEYIVAAKADDSDFVTDDSYYLFTQTVEGALTSAVGRNQNFFDQLYNNLCEYGYVVDGAVQDSEYFEQAIKNGKYLISTVNENDGYFYQRAYNEACSYLVEETDENRISVAEAEFNAKKAEITFKEERVTMESKNLDAEIAALNSEISSVQNMINSHMNGFKMFQ